MKRRSLYFTGPRQVEVREEEMPEIKGDEVLVQTKVSAISSGTELLIYRGQAPGDLAADENIESLAGSLRFPLKYGYAAVGEVIQAGAEVEAGWVGREVFAFNPHESHFAAKPERLLRLPKGIEAEEAAFLPNVETAVNFAMDGRPMVGERVLVFGQGIVGLLTTALLSRFPLGALVTVEGLAKRREASLEAGAEKSIPPDDDVVAKAVEAMGGEADVSFELSGAPQALNAAIAATGYGGRIVIGSWYGVKRAELDLGGRFHRSRIQLISSQVSTLAPELRGRWTKERRFETAWAMLRGIKPGRFVTHRFPIEEAGEAYRLLDEGAGDAIGVVFTY